MEPFENYFTSEAIVSHLCKLRAKVANQRNKKHLIHLLTTSEKYNYHNKEAERHSTIQDGKLNGYTLYEIQLLNQLKTLLPPRRKWIILGSKSRVTKSTNQPITATDRNYYSLIKTIKQFRKKSPNEPWLQALDAFINEIQNEVASCGYQISTPTIYPKLKNEKKNNGQNECRPICLFNLKDRIILSITNKYLTRLFDSCFEDCSYAFRSKKNKQGTTTLSHHDCIKDIQEYKRKHPNSPLYVAECDMEKFYDTVNHKIAKVLYNELIRKCEQLYPCINFGNATHIFNQFLECYSFNKNVPQPHDSEYWESYRIPNGHFKWVEADFKKFGYYTDQAVERIGIPQGGALSGLIANIMLNAADKVVLQSGAFYLRFCDDMIILHPDKDTCEIAKELYVNTLKGLKLIPHEFKDNTQLKESRKNNRKGKLAISQVTYAPFWKGKSKGPYKWDSLANNGFPWIGFVGYELHHDGHIRVRKKSFLKELKKQKEVVEDIINAVKDGMRKSTGSVTESAIHRLVGMSVGRVNLKNYKIAANDLCWKNGFKELKPNRYSIQQIKQLDRNRNKLYYSLTRHLKKPEEENKPESKPRQIIHFNKPFSYYYQVLGRVNSAEDQLSSSIE